MMKVYDYQIIKLRDGGEALADARAAGLAGFRYVGSALDGLVFERVHNEPVPRKRPAAPRSAPLVKTPT